MLLYPHYLDAISMTVDEVMVPEYMDLLALLTLLQTSKQLRNKINARPCIAQYIRAAIGIPIERARFPTKVLTFFNIRRGANQIPHNILMEYGLAMKEACICCLQHGYRTRRAYRKGKDRELLFTNGLDECQDCENTHWLSWQRKTCKHPSHDTTKRRVNNNQLLCNECFAKV